MNTKELRFTVHTYQCDPSGRIRLCSLMQHLQEIASLHADQLGFGYEKMRQIDGYWVLSNYRLEINSLPKWNDNFTIQTWPSGHTRLLATREFIGKDHDGAEIFRAGSEWMILSRTNNRPQNLIRLQIDKLNTGPQIISQTLSRLESQSDYNHTQQIHVPYSSLDLNAHVNNTEYVRWALDALKAVFPSLPSPRSLQITYLAELFENDPLDLALTSNHNATYYVRAQKPPDNTPAFLLQLSC